MLTGISRLSTVDAGGLFCARIAVDIRGLRQGCHFPPATFADRGWPAPGPVLPRRLAATRLLVGHHLLVLVWTAVTTALVLTVFKTSVGAALKSIA
jgi:hypothetical protein